MSIPATVRARRRGLWAGVAGLLVTVLAIVVIISRVPIGFRSQDLLIPGIVVAGLGFVVAVLGLICYLFEDGVVLLPWPPRGEHELL